VNTNTLFRILLLFCLSFTLQASTELEIIDLKNRTADEIIPMIKPFAGAGGTVTGQGYKLIVKAQPANMAEIKKIVAQLDGASQQLIISVQQGGTRTESGSGAGISGHVNSGDVSARVPSQTPSRGGATIIGSNDDSKIKARIYSNKKNDDTTGIQRIRTLEGEAAFIQAGQAVPLPQRTVTSDRYGTIVQDTIEYKNVTTGFYVIARVSGDNVSLHISPQQERLSRGGHGHIDVSRADTTVRGRLGEWIDIGGVNQDSRSERSGTLSYSQNSISTTHNILLKVELAE
jgi:type II secretory pathway component GspD/PulD (secretin)